MPLRIWSTIDLFWLCYSRTPGLSGWNLQRTALPNAGTVMDQDRWTMSAFQILEGVFYAVDQERQSESQRAKELAKVHEKVRGAK